MAFSSAGEIAFQLRQVGERGGASAIDLGILQEIFGTRRQIAGQLCDELFAGRDLQRVVGEALGADRGRTLGAHVAAAERTGAVGGIHQHLIRQLQQFVMQAVIEHACQLFGRVRAGKIGTAHVTDKQRVAGQYGPRLQRLLIIGDHQADALQSMAWSFENLDSALPKRKFEAVVNGHVRERCAGLSAEINFGPGAGGEFLVSGDKIGMQVSFKNMADDQPFSSAAFR